MLTTFDKLNETEKAAILAGIEAAGKDAEDILSCDLDGSVIIEGGTIADALAIRKTWAEAGELMEKTETMIHVYGSQALKGQKRSSHIVVALEGNRLAWLKA